MVGFQLRYGFVHRFRLSIFGMLNEIPQGWAQRGNEVKTPPNSGSGKGVDHSNWAVQYLQVRKLAGLELMPDQHGPMLPAPLNEQATCWAARALTSEEGSAFLRKVLDAPKTTSRRLSTHSMKSIVLSWASKYGLPDTSRAVLARHVSSVATATAVYSRDLLSPQSA